MADFHQSNSIATLHRLRTGRLPQFESDLQRYSQTTGVSLILPALITEFERPAMLRIVSDLRKASYYNEIVVAIGRATESQVREAAGYFTDFQSPVSILWIEDPRMQGVLRSLEGAGLPAPVDGKGRTCWLSMGYLLAKGEADVIALHDCDIATYTREIPAALSYPLAHPGMDFDFCKGYYARISDKLHGRVTRLFLAPLLESLREHTAGSPFLDFLTEFRYPLAGEFALRSSLARQIRIPADWGLEVGVLSEVFRLAGASRVCQSDLTENYEHKHQDLSAGDPSRGLRRMTYDISGALIGCLREHGLHLEAGEMRRVADGYLHHAGEKVRQYEADAWMNGLRYDRTEEIGAVHSFADSLHEAIVTGGEARVSLPEWERVETEAPWILRQLSDCSFPSGRPASVTVPNWVQSARLDRLTAGAR